MVTKINGFLITVFLFLTNSVNSYAQFNKTYSSDINYKPLSYQVCTETAEHRTDIKIGMEFILEATTNEKITLNQIWIFPKEIADEKGAKFKEVRTSIEKPTNEKINLSFNMSESSNLIRGKWKYRLYHKKKLLVEKEFWIE